MSAGWPSWIAFALAGLFLAGIKGFWLKRTAVQVGKPQQVHLLSILTTLLLGVVVLAVQRPEMPESPNKFFGLCLLGGLGYTATGILSSVAQRHLKLSVFHSGMKLASFIPIAYFWLVAGETITTTQWMGIVSSAFPLFMISLVTPSAQRGETVPRGMVALGGAILGTSALQMVNAIAVGGTFGLGIDPIVFIIGLNAVSGVASIAAIRIKKDFVRIDRQLFVAGTLAGVLNIASFACFLEALRSGPASVIIPLNSFHVFISTVLTETFPTKRAKLGVAFLLFVALGSIALLLNLDG